MKSHSPDGKMYLFHMKFKELFNFTIKNNKMKQCVFNSANLI